MTDALVVLVTAPSPKVAAELARTLVTERLAACGSVLPGLRSIYRWKGRVRDDAEALLLLKTTRARFPALRDRVLALHPYDAPEVLALPVEAGSDAYLDWVGESVALEARPEPRPERRRPGRAGGRGVVRRKRRRQL